MDLIKTVILGAVQGVTEWLPVSSTGHLKVMEHFLQFSNPQDSLLFEFILHIGTLLVLLIFFRTEIKNILSVLVHLDFKSEYGRMIPLLVAGTVPAVIIGVALKETIEQTFQNLLPIAVALALFGVFLYVTKLGKETTSTISYPTAILIGIAEGLAIIPGISRSGATIATALLLGINRKKAFNFSLLLSMPAIIGAVGYTAYTDYGTLSLAGLGWTEIILGVGMAMVVGYIALKLLWKTLEKEKFHLFAFYCWLFGAAIIALSLGGF